VVQDEDEEDKEFCFWAFFLHANRAGWRGNATGLAPPTNDKTIYQITDNG